MSERRKVSVSLSVAPRPTSVYERLEQRWNQARYENMIKFCLFNGVRAFGKAGTASRGGPGKGPAGLVSFGLIELPARGERCP